MVWGDPHRKPEVTDMRSRVLAALPLLLAAACGGTPPPPATTGTTTTGSAGATSGATSSGAGTTGSAAPSCTDVCAHLDALCGASNDQLCAQNCPSLGSNVQGCILAATSCDAANACGSSSSTGTSGTSTSTSGTTGSTASATDTSCHGPQVPSGTGPYQCASGCTMESLNGATFCTHSCSADADCSADNGTTTTYVCDTQVGLCAVWCVHDSDCTAVGLTSCDPYAHFCG